MDLQSQQGTLDLTDFRGRHTETCAMTSVGKKAGLSGRAESREQSTDISGDTRGNM